MRDRSTSRWAPLSVPGFRSLWLAGVLSWYGDFLTVPALLIVGYRIGGVVAVGLVVAFQTIPLLALLPYGGHLGDLGDRRRRLVALDLVRAALAALIVVGARADLLVIVLAGVAASKSASALYDPGRRRLVPVLLPPGLVSAGGSLLSVSSETSILVAPALGALLLLVLTPSYLIVMDGCTFLVSALLLSRVGAQPSVHRALRSSTEGWRAIRRGFDLLLLDNTIGLFVIQAGLGALLAAVITVYFVPLVHQGLHLGTNQVGVMYVIVGAASVVGSALALRRPQVRRRSLVVVGYLHLVAALFVGLMLGPAGVVVALAVFAGSGALQEVWGLNRLQTTTPRDGIGQAFGAALWFQYMGRALGAVVGGWGATHLPQASFFGLVVVAAVVVCVLVSLSRASLWRRRTINWPPGGPPLPLEP